jgi:hypothetical protein
MRAAFLLFITLVNLAFCQLWAQKGRLQPYQPGEGLTYSQANRYSIRLSGMLQPMVESRFYPGFKTDGQQYNRFRLRRMIAKFSGNAAKEKIGYQIQIDLTGSSDAGGDANNNQYLMDAWISYRATRNLEIVVGQDNTPTDSRELGMLSNALQMVERSPVSLAFSSIREFGVFANYKLKTGRVGVLHPHLALTNGDGANVLGKDHGGLKFGGRLDYLPFGSFSHFGQYRQPDIEHELTPKLVIGATYSLNKGISDRRGRSSGEILYLDSAGNEVLPDYSKFSLDLLFKYRGFSLMGEYVNAQATVPTTVSQRVRTDGTTAPTFLVNGVQDVSAYVKNRIILGSGYNVQAGYFFRDGFSIDARYSKLSPAANSFLRNGRFYNRTDFYTLCLSRYLGPHYGAKVQASITYAKAQPGSLTVIGQPIKGNEITTALMFTFAL